jgi:osmotically-inducible protein OsmY
MSGEQDRSIRQHVENALRYNPLTRNAAIAVYVKDGVAILHGDVETHAQKRAVERVVKGVAGVRGFAEELTVTPPERHRRGDDALARAALDALRWHALVPDERIQVKVEHGWLTLMGNVTWNVERQAAADAVAHLIGLRGVSNHITLIPHAKPADVHDAIRRALDRSAQLDAKGVEVEIDGARATLRGTVKSWTAYDDAEHAVWSCAGISEVRNFLVVMP